MKNKRSAQGLHFMATPYHFHMIRQLSRIAEALEKKEGKTKPSAESLINDDTMAHHWDGLYGTLKSVDSFAPLPLHCLVGIEKQRDSLLENTRRFAAGKPANHALLWGARGAGKSALIKSACQSVKDETGAPLYFITIARDEILSLTELKSILRDLRDKRFILFCDDISFASDDTSGKILKSILDGAADGTPDNMLLYATSNRRHLIPREMTENESQAAIHSHEAADDHISLSDRFGLWLGFHPMNQMTYLKAIEAYVEHFGIMSDFNVITDQALEWARTRGGFSGRMAWQFIQSIR